tara:strand:- start:1289 stop:2194 length:906 start_codon:yes stop_codon:yes gene_type:complete
MSVTIGNITNRIKSNKQNIKINLNVNPEFEQQNTIPKRVKKSLDKLKKEPIETPGDINYCENEVINIPNKLDNLFDNLLCDNYYLYGIPISSHSFLSSLLYVILGDFKFKTVTEQSKFAVQLSESLKDDIDKYFKTNKYSSIGYKKMSMIDNIENGVWENSELHYLSDYYNINLIILDYYKFTYHSGQNYNEKNNNVIIVKYNDIYLPFIHIFGEYPSNLIYKCIVNKLKINNLNDSTPKIIGTDKIKDHEPTKKGVFLKAITSYKLDELQKLANLNNISIQKENSKNKTKKQLYDNLSSL